MCKNRPDYSIDHTSAIVLGKFMGIFLKIFNLTLFKETKPLLKNRN